MTASTGTLKKLLALLLYPLIAGFAAGGCELFSDPEPEPEITGIRTFPSSLTLLEGEEYQFWKLVVSSTDGLVILPDATWESEDPGVAAVGGIRYPAGQTPEVSVQAVSEGETRFVATGHGVTGYGFVRVTRNEVCSQTVGGLPEVAEETETADLCEASTSDLYLGPIDHSWGDESQVPDQDQREDHTDYRGVGGQFIGSWATPLWNAVQTRLAAGGATVISGDDEPEDGDPYAVAYALAQARIPVSGSAYLEYAVVVDRDGNGANNFVPEPGFEDHWALDGDFLYSLQYRPDLTEWRLFAFDLSSEEGSAEPTMPRSVSTTARAILADASVIWLLPLDPDQPNARIRFTAFEHDGNFGFGAPWSGDTVPPQGEMIRFIDLSAF